MAVRLRSFLCILAGGIFGLLLCSLRHSSCSNWIVSPIRAAFDVAIAQPVKSTKGPKILCYINTFPEVLEKRAIHAQNTWARRCDKFLFTTTKTHPNLQVMVVNMTEPEIRKHLWVKMRQILRQIYHYADEYDYFFKADDDTYAILPNLRKFLETQSPKELTMFGMEMKHPACKSGFHSGGAGYVLTQESLKRIVEKAIDRHPLCPTTDEDQEDVKMCICGTAVGINLTFPDGENHKPAFFPISPMWKYKLYQPWIESTLPTEFDPSNPFMRHTHLWFNADQISFHYMKPTDQYMTEFLTYILHPIGT